MSKGFAICFRMRTLKTVVVAVLLLASLPAFSLPQNGTENPFSVCADPANRAPMSQLQAAFSGPLYSQYQFRIAKTRFIEAYEEAGKRGLLVESADPASYLQSLNFETHLSSALTAARLMFILYDKGGLKGSWTNLTVEEIPNRAAVLVCGHCTSKKREAIADHVEDYITQLNKNMRRQTATQVAEGLSTNVEGLNDILAAVTKPDYNTDFVNYYKHIAALHHWGANNLLETARMQAHIGGWYRNVDFKDGKVPKHNSKITVDVVRQAAEEFYTFIRESSDRISDGYSVGMNQQGIDRKIAWYYIHAPGIVARVLRANPQFANLQCRYLAFSLEVAGLEDVQAVRGQGLFTLGPMAVFWGVGLTTGMVMGIPAPITFTAVALIGLAEIGWRSYQVGRLQSWASALRFYTLIGGTDPHGVLRTGDYKHLIAQDQHNLQMVMLYQGLSLFGGGLLTRVVDPSAVGTGLMLKDVLDAFIFNDKMFDPPGGDWRERSRLRN